MNYWTQNEKNIWVAAHRGWCAGYPENTMVAYRKAVELGVDQLEIDVRMTKDGELVLMHDGTVDRTTNGTGRICDMTLAEVKTLDAGVKKGAEFTGTRVPTFRELLEYLKDHPTMTVDVELKEKPADGNDQRAFEACDKTIAMIEEYGFGDRVILNAFHGGMHAYIKKAYGEKYRRHVYYPITLMRPCSENPYDGAYAACMSTSFYSELNLARPEECAHMRSLGIQPWAGAAVKDEESVDAAIACGVTLITCNNPDEVLAILRRKGYHK